MKRTTRQQPSDSGKRAVTLDPHRLIAARGGDELGITIRVLPPVDPVMQIQHSELVVRV